MHNVTSKNFIIELENLIQKNFWKLVFTSLILFFFVKYSVLFIILLFLTLDTINSYLSIKSPLLFIPVDFFLMMTFLLGYTGHVLIALILAPLVIVSRLIFGKFEKRHLIKIPILFVIIGISIFLSNINVVTAGLIVISLRYFIEYTIEIMTGAIDFKRIPQRICNVIGGLIFLQLLGSLIISVL